MSKIRELIEEAKKEVKSRDNYDNSGGMFSCHDTHDIDIREVINIIDKLEQAIKAEIMGLQRHYVNGIGQKGATYRKSDISHPENVLMASDLENLFQESE